MNRKGKIIVIGSINMDIVHHVERFPLPGETIHSVSSVHQPGGKGANQAVAAARMGANVAMVGAVGDDAYGNMLTDRLLEDGIDTEHVFRKNGSSGTAFITVDASGENQIVLSSGTNSMLSIEEVMQVPDLFHEDNIILLQNEINFAVTKHVIQRAYEKKMAAYFNPAPALSLSDEILQKIDTLILNETELEVVTGTKFRSREEAETLAKQLVSKGCQQVLLTFGANGAMIVDSHQSLFVPAFQVEPVDTTAAGDTFIGAYAASVLAGMNMEKALIRASAAAAIAVTKSGAQSSIPTASEVEHFLQSSEKRS